MKIRKGVNVVAKLSKRVKKAISDILERWQGEVYNPIQDGY